MKRQKGQSLVEFMIVIPFLLILVVLILDVAFLMYEVQAVQSAIREAGRAAQVWRPNTAGTSCVEDAQAAVDRTVLFDDVTLIVSDNCQYSGSFNRIGREVIDLSLITNHQLLVDQIFNIFFEDGIPLDISISVMHE